MKSSKRLISLVVIFSFVVTFQFALNLKVVQADITCVQGEDLHTEPGPTCLKGGVPLNSNNDVTTPTPAGGNNAGKSDPFEQFAYWIAIVIYTFTVGLGSAVAWLGSNILNYAVQFSLDSRAYNLDFISTGWTMLRDIANMSFIFILVYIAIQVMFQAQTHGTLERLVKVLAVALIINFSFFGTRVVIDAGNLISVQFYNAIVGSSADLTTSIMNGLNFTSALNENSFKQVSQTVSGGSLSALISFAFIYIVLGAALFMLAAAFVTAGIKFIFRIAMLWVSIVTAPLALVAWSIQGGGGHGGGHGGGGYFSRWLKNLVNHALYPTVFLFVLLLITNFMKGLTDQGGFGSISVTDSGWQGLVGTLANIIVRLAFVLVMLYFALKSSDYFDTAGASLAKAWGNNVAFGLPALLGRNTIGRASFGIANNLSENSKFKAPLNLLARSSFDVRNAKVPLAKKVTGKDFGLAKQADKLGFGKPGGNDGYVGDVERKAKALANEANHHREGMLSEATESHKIYNDMGGAQGIKDELNRIAFEITRLRKQEEKLTVRGINNLNDAEKKTLEQLQKQRETAEKQADKLHNISGTITDMAKKIVADRNRHHEQHSYENLVSSNSVAKQLAARRLKMTPEEKKAEKEAEKEHAEHEKHDSGGGGGEKKGGGGGGDHH